MANCVLNRKIISGSTDFNSEILVDNQTWNNGEWVYTFTKHYDVVYVIFTFAWDGGTTATIRTAEITSSQGGYNKITYGTSYANSGMLNGWNINSGDKVTLNGRILCASTIIGMTAK